MNQPAKWILGIFGPAALLLCLFTFGNPQWHKYFYMWQYYVLIDGTDINPYTANIIFHPDQKPRVLQFLAMPVNYNGLWRHWSKTGDLVYEVDVIDGQHNGWYREYVKNQIVRESNCVEGVLKGLVMRYGCSSGQIETMTENNPRYHLLQGINIEFFESGHVSSICTLKDGFRHGISYYFNEADRLSMITLHKKNEDITVCDYDAGNFTDIRHEYPEEMKKFELEFGAFVERVKGILPELDNLKQSSWYKALIPEEKLDDKPFPGGTYGIFNDGNIISNSVIIMGDEE